MKNVNCARYEILGFLLQGPRHGYDLYHEFSDPHGLGQVWYLGMSLMYQELKKLEAAGLVRATVESQDPRPPKKIYALTPKGRQVFWKWLESPARGLRELRVDFLIRLFFAQRQGPQQVRRLLDLQIPALRHELETLQAAKSDSWSAGEYVQQVQQFRIRQLQAALDWLLSCYPEPVST